MNTPPAPPALDPAYAQAAQRLRDASCQPAEPLHAPLAQARAQQDRHFAFLNEELPPIHAAQEFHPPGPAGALSLRVVQARPAAGPSPVVIFVRGAGWWAGSLHSHERTARVIAHETGAACLVLDYRRSPEHRFPTQLEELLATLAWVREAGAAHGLDGSRIVLWGESAGATTSLLAAQRLRDDGALPVQALVLFYGNFDGPGPNTRAQSRWVWQQLLGEAWEAPPAAAIPARQPVHGLPPTWLGVGDADPLLADTLALQARLQAAGVPHACRRWPGLPHAFMTMTRLLPAATQAVREAWSFVEPVLSARR
ncbi:MAG: hypothetical protein RI988_1675 [Pseudomonadota bacterium]|jgi:acetyl esterase